ncbi:MAG TPA: hypothetical protein RMH85_32955 [Polyangiaceae bacterium LLY-WYZ-15_(1-7)]|nr:hypothetical protein [Myxococcales bacterium]MAT30055.1 hypothetical protein [Sandaracinus sp.]HJK92548.1 hypothetical protein [Polyangiaceae bacterium LLY-WYZ-15_(1-7)]HJL00075.1 hypothetical protein [Polyangiaceae bacterium LLY-WYZ-15_(1-7)]HJL13338.1 hypothetical protein [Polyangiaceae bacterium LLY-WYZ-15_(1-7)]
MRPLVLALGFSLGCSLLFAALVAAQGRRGVPRAVREALVGCWVPWEGERWEITRQGETGLRARITYPDREALRARFRLRGTPRPHRASLTWVEEREQAQLACGPTTQHGQFCALRVDEEGELEVALYARGWGRNRRRGRLVDTVRPRRCE